MTTHSLPSFSNLDIDNYVAQLDGVLAKNLLEIATILNNNTSFTWDNLMRPMELMEDELERFWSPLSHLHAVVNSPALRVCYQACLPKLSAYESAIGQNQALYDAVNSLDKSTLSPVQFKIVEDALRDFKLSGVALSLENKRRFEEISAQVSTLSNQFENNILDAVQDFHLHITDEARMAGLPEHAIATAKALAEEKKLPGWLLSLEQPCYVAVVTHAEDRALRETLYEAYCTRASDQGPSAGKFDNTQAMNDLLALRFEAARMLDFANYAELSIATKMAESTKQVNDFLQDLVSHAHHQAVSEFKELQAFARDHYQLNTIEPWDIAYLSEKKQHASFQISQEMLRPYFPLKKVMEGLFTIVNKLYGMTFVKIEDADTWHPDVTCYAVLDEKADHRGYIYIDLFARPHKRGGAWMNSCQSRFKLLNGQAQLAIATLTCNFAKATEKKPPMLSHDEVLTLFHEFGHCLHHVLTQVDYISASGVHGVEWDAVELPSQFFENWCWDQEALTLLTEHVETEESLPAALFNALIASKNFQSAMAMMRQLEFSIFDFRIHEEYTDDDPQFIPKILNDVRKKTTVVPTTPYNRFQHSFSHIFAGGYAAGYYSYKWAEVLSSDAFARFEEEGIFNPKTGRDFLHTILEVGGSCKALPAFVAFRGRMATVDALLRHNGIIR
ncbi:MAG: M3 family metallopeptidase [Legionellaceae bacterium]|nr:M3 family metallopeptidase [Legionellaceae bacterium]